MRRATIKRKTAETNIEVELDLDGTGTNDVNTTIRFFDHMLATFAKHGFFDLVVRAEGDLNHHIIEDTGIALGETFKHAIDAEEREKTVRFGSAIIPMDESIAKCAVDIGGIGGEGRRYSVFDVNFRKDTVEDVSTENIPHFISSFATHANFTIHVHAQGENEHHKVEAIFKALGIALDIATRVEERSRCGV